MINRSIILFLLFFSAMAAYAGGYRVSLQGGRALAMGHTGVGVIDNAEGAFFNPSSLVHLKNRLEIAAGVSVVYSKIQWQNQGTGQSERTHNAPSTPLYIYSNYHINDQFSVGLSVFTPYGSVVEYTTDWPGSHLVNKIDLSAFYIQPHVAYRINEKLSVAAGPIIAIGSVEFNRNLSRTMTDIDGNRSNVTIDASGVVKLGWHLSATYVPMEGLTVGATYRSEMIMDPTDGDAKFRNLPNSPITNFKDTKISAELPLPAELLVGVAYEFDKWTLAFDYNHAFWDVYKSLDIYFEDESIPDSKNPRNYKNSSSYRFGAQYQLNEKIALRAGYYFDQTPVQSGYFAPETPRGDSHNFTIGGGYNFSSNFRVDVAFMYIHFKEINESYDHYSEAGIVEGGAKVPFGGDWKTSGLVPSIGLTYRM